MYEAGYRVDRRYDIIAQIGAGSMGVVYRAYDRLTVQEVALKRVMTVSSLRASPTATTSQEYRLALAQEFKILATLRHPHIISVLDYGFDTFNEDKHPYYTMRLLHEGENIITASRGVSLQTKVEYIIQVLRALMYLHRRGILHRDLKPANIYLVDEKVKLLDFGLAIAGGNREIREVVGTLAYMAPELLRGGGASIPSDLYAVGILAYEMLAGVHPFDLQNPTQLIEDISLTEPDLSILDVDLALAAVLEKLLLKRPENRYQNAHDVIQALSNATRRELPPETRAIRESFLQAADFVGRETEMTTLIAGVNTLMQGQGSAWLIGGESGIGKSRLIEEFRIHALVNGVLVIRGEAIAEGGPAYRMWRQVLRWLALIVDDITDEEVSVFKWLLPDINEILDRDVLPLPVTTPQGMQKRLVAIVKRIIKRQQRPIVLILEDLHWATEGIAVLSEMTQGIIELPVMIVASYRNDESPTLFEQLPAMRHIVLERLSNAHVAQLTKAMLGDVGGNGEVVNLIQRETEGNIFFIVEVVRALAEEAGQLDQIGKLTLPENVLVGGIQQLVQRRLERIPTEAYPLLELAAIAGRYIDVILLGHLQPDVDLGAWLMICANRAVLEVYQDQWRFVHDKLREGVITKIETARRQAMHRQVAIAIEEVYTNGQSDRVMRLAYHWQEADDTEKERHYARLAGDYLLMSSAFRESIVYYQRALELTSDDDPLKIEILTQLGDVNTVLDFRAATDYLRRAAFLAREAGDRHRMARSLTQLGRLALFREGDLEQAQFYQQEALVAAHAVNDPIGMAMVLWQMGNFEMVTGRYEQARAFLLASIEATRADKNGQMYEALALQSLSHVLSKLGAFNDAIILAERVRHLGREIGNRQLVMLGTVQHAYAEFIHGNYEQALAYFRLAYEINQQIADQEQLGRVANYIGDCLMKMGNYLDAGATYHEALQICMETQLMPEVLKAISGIAVVKGRTGEKETALELLTFTLNHPVCNQETYEFRGEVLEALRSELSQETIQEMTARGLKRGLEATAHELLNPDQ